MKDTLPEKLHNRRLVIFVNIFIFCLISIVFYFYGFFYRAKLHEQNLDDIININQSSANIGSSFFRDRQRELANIVQYITLHHLNTSESLSFIADSHSSRDEYYELVGTDKQGFSSLRENNEFIPVDYTNRDYQTLTAILSGPANIQSYAIRYTPEFTDGISARRSFALYTQLRIENDDGTVTRYTLLDVLQSNSFSSFTELNAGYAGMATVFMTTSGDYVFGSSEFKAGNLFQYLYEYNELTLDQKEQIASDLTAGRKGNFSFKNSKGQKCAFVYTTVPGTKWYCVSCVPYSSFRKNNQDVVFMLLITMLLVILMVFNFVWLNVMNHRLRTSVMNEKKAGEAKTDFLSRMSHDIRTPLNVIIGMTILAEKENNPPASVDYLKHINEAGKYLLSLVNDILDINKVESGKMDLHPVPYQFTEFAESMNAIISPLCIDKDIAFKITVSNPNASYMLDPVRTNQIFYNILSNSVKFTAPGGHISLDCKDSAQSDGSTILCVTASDDGIGMSEEFQKHMYDAFTQEENKITPSYQGTGLGLTIVKRLVDLMKGTISVKSMPGKGTTFVISIPTKQMLAQPKKTHDAVFQSHILEGKHILLFEDNELNAEIAQGILKERHMIVDCASNGKTGLEMFESSPLHTYDAVLMDLRMPVMDGFAATKAIRTLPRSDVSTLPIVAMTANAYDVDIQNCLAAGMNAHVAKPINPEELFTVLSRELTASQIS